MVSIYLKAFIISIVIFISGLFVGLFVESYLVSNVISRTSELENSIQEIELEMLYFQNLNETYSCPFLNEIVRKTNNNLDTLAQQLTMYSEKNVIFTPKEIRDLKAKYSFLLIKDWLLQEKIKLTCGTDVVTILYFYDREGCDDCVIQGNILSVLKESFKEKLMVFSLDRRVELSMINILMERYNVTKMPSIVIDEKVYSGITSKDQIKTLICNQISNVTACL